MCGRNSDGTLKVVRTFAESSIFDRFGSLTDFYQFPYTDFMIKDFVKTLSVLYRTVENVRASFPPRTFGKKRHCTINGSSPNFVSNNI